MTGRTDRYRALISKFPRTKLVVAGDLLADEFIYGRVERVSREAPVLILQYDATEIVPGGAGNAASNAAALGSPVTVVGVVGQDDPGRRLLAALPRRAKTRSVVRAPGFVTPVKTRILAGGVHSAKQQVVRIDRTGRPVSAAIGKRIETALVRAMADADAVIVSDYGGGSMTPERWERARRPRRGKPIISLVDSRYALGEFTGMTACTPNESEVEALLGIRLGEDVSALEHAGRTLLARLQCQAVLITRGSRGMALFEPGRPTVHIPIVGSDQIADVTGAGDTVIATMTLALSAGASFEDAARLANRAGGLVVMKRGTATVPARELADAVTSDHDTSLENWSQEGPAQGRRS
jgi:rfaE bifunctional protein kinase chain/domain